MRTEDAKKVRTIDSLLVELAKERGLDEERTKRAIDLVRFGLLCLLSGDEAHGDMLDRLHAVYRGAQPRGKKSDEERDYAALHDAEASVEAVARRMPTPEHGVSMLLPMLERLGAQTGSLDRKWLATRLAKLRDELAARDRGTRSKLGAGVVAAEIAWRCSAFGADACRTASDGDEPSEEWLVNARKALRRRR